MKNMIKYKYVIYTMLLVFASSCMDDDLNYPEQNKPFVTSDVTNYTLVEGEAATFTLNLSRAIGTKVDVKIEQVSGNATTDDYSFSIDDLAEYEFGPAGYVTSIPAAQTSSQVTITSTEDFIPDAGETATFRIVGGENGRGLVQGGEILFTVTFTNVERDYAVAELAWNEVDNPSEDYDLCKIDYDFFFGEANVYAYTGNCPEVISEPVDPASLFTEVLADGSYTVYADLWDLNDVLADALEDNPNLVVEIPLRLTIGKYGQVLANIDLAGLYNTNSSFSNAENGGVAGSGEKLIATIEVINGLYSIYNIEGELVAQEQ